MAGSLNAILTEINRRLPSGTTTGIGARALSARESAPRVVWVPTTDDFAAPRQGGAGTPSNPTVAEPRALATTVTTVEAHIWAVDVDGVEALRDAICRAVYDVCWGSCELRAGTWGQTGEAIASGAAYILLVAFHVPLTRASTATGIPTSLPLTATVVQAG